MSETVHPDLCLLAGVEHCPGEDRRCSLVFHLESASGRKLHITYGDVMAILREAQDQNCIPPLPPGWWARIGDTHGCS